MKHHIAVFLLSLSVAIAQPFAAKESKEPSWDTAQTRGKTRSVNFVAQEGTWMSVDISPDGKWLVFDLLAHVYRVPASGGEAECLTQASGAALNFHPRYSPDGKSIAFVSDRGGQNNLWIMNADGSRPRAVFSNKDIRVFEPAWTPDGQFLIVRRANVANRAGGPATGGLWMYHKDGGEGVEVVSGTAARGAAWPSVSPDGHHVYFHSIVCEGRQSGQQDAVQGCQQVKRVDLKTGVIDDITSGQNQQQSRASSGGGVAPEASPDGHWLTFARRIPDGTISYKGHKFGPRTALILRNLDTGAERVVMDPIEMDMAEGMKTWRVLPGYNWTKDSKSIWISQGGKIRKLDVASGRVDTIAFSAKVERTLSEMAYKNVPLDEGPVKTRFARWPTASGGKLAFQAFGKIWISDMAGGTPRRLTNLPAQIFEYSPAWSPDGRSVAFTTWEEKRAGQVWIGDAAGGTPRQVTSTAGEYLQTAWSADGRELVLARGSGETFRGRTMVENPWWEIVRVPAAGGPVTAVATDKAAGGRRAVVQPSYGPEGRIFFPEFTTEHRDGRDQPVTDFVSVRPDGGDRRVHMKFSFADEAVISPDGKYVAFQEGDNVYLTPFFWDGVGAQPLQADKKKAKFPIKALSKEGGMFVHWRDTTTVEFGSGGMHYTYHVDTEKTDAANITLTQPRDVPKGSVALTGAKIVTLDNRRVIDRGTVVVKDGRIACIGECSTTGATVIDARGKTIIPGWIDMHAHHHRENSGMVPPHDWENAVYLAYGVTTTLDPAPWSQNVFPTAELVEAGLVLGPRIFATGDPLYNGDGARQNEITSAEVAEQNVNRLANWGSVSMKQYLQPRRDQRQWVAEAARKRGLMVTAEGDSLEYNIGMILDGQTGFEHPMSYSPLYADAAKFFGLAHAVYSPTFIVGGAGPWNEEYFWQESDVWKDEKARRWLPWRNLIPNTRRRILRPATDYSFPMIAQGLADIIAEGGYGAIGSHGQQHGIGSHWETWMAASALGPMGALEVASVHGAHFLGVEKDLGSITVGKLGDLMVLDADPLADIHNTAKIAYVMKAGRLWQASTLDEVWPAKKPFGDYYWVDADALRSDDRPVNYWDRQR
jgi:Tol biopolymer transport system component/imidazolonepropionase-like amidohydrolase